MDKLNKKQLNRLITFGRRVWNSLTKEEQEDYYYKHVYELITKEKK